MSSVHLYIIQIELGNGNLLLGPLPDCNFHDSTKFCGNKEIADQYLFSERYSFNTNIEAWIFDSTKTTCYVNEIHKNLEAIRNCANAYLQYRNVPEDYKRYRTKLLSPEITRQHKVLYHSFVKTGRSFLSFLHFAGALIWLR